MTLAIRGSGTVIKVHAVHAGNRQLYEDALEQHHRIRHNIYVGERRWMDLARPDEREVDQFDTDKAVYLLGIEPDGRVVAGSRLVPTLEPHLLSDVFPELAAVRGVPRAPDIYEWTRIFVVPERRANHHRCHAAGVIFCGILEFCIAQGIRQLSVVCEAFWIPRLLALKWRPRPLGEPAVKDGMTIVGLTFDMTEEALAATRSSYEIEGTVMSDADAAVIPPVLEKARVYHA
jgi:acyl-homoserine lactone synthase